MSSHSWRDRAGWAVLFFFPLFFLPLRAHGQEWRLLAESADGSLLRLEVRLPPPLRAQQDVDGISFTRFHLPDTRAAGSPGAPELLVLSRLVALPPGGEATLQILEMEADEEADVRVIPRAFEGVSYGEGGSPENPSTGMATTWYAYDAAAYVQDGPRTEPAVLGPSGTLRHLQVARLEVWPLLYDPQTRDLRIVRRLVLEVRLRAGRRGLDPMAALALQRTPLPWLQIYDRVLVNGQSARHWLQVPPRAERLGKALESGMLRPGLLGEDQWKIRVRSTGPLRVPAALLLDAGFPDGTPVERLRLVLQRFDPAAPLEPRIFEIPLQLEDDGDGLFRGGDSFVFHAEQPRDDATAGERAARYSATNVYWLSVAETGTPARMPVRTPLVGTLPGPTQFAQELVIEEDRILNLWVFGDDEELYFLLDRALVGQEAVWRTSAPGRAAGADLQICVDTQQDWLRRYFSVSAQFQSGQRVALGSSNGVVPDDAPPPVITVCGTVPAAQIEPGDFTVVVTPLTPPTPPDGYDDTSPFVDRIVLRYQADYVATGDRLRCTSAGATGPTAFTLTGFSGQPLLALDITDPKAPAWFDLTGALVGGTLTLTDDVPSGATRVYVVAPRAGIPAASAADVERDTTDPILDELATLPMGSYDALVVSHDSFADDPKLQEWKGFRESQGVRVRAVRTSDVYDAFNGGLSHYDPIYQLVRAAYENWGIAYVLLVGDGSEDPIRVRPTSGANLVPDRMIYDAVRASSGGGNEYRNDIYERHYVKMDGEFDNYPDLLLGRWPASDAEDLHNIVDKTLLYERPAAGDDGSWRKRVVLFSDDEWIRRVRELAGFVHLRGCEEWLFFQSIRRCCDIVDHAFPGDLHCVPFYQHEFSNKLAEPPWNAPEHTAWPYDQYPYPGYPSGCFAEPPAYALPHTGPNEFQFYLNTVGTALTDSIGDGALFFALQSHANRSQVTDEGTIRTRATDPVSPFLPDFRNHGKPFVFFGFGCHLNEFGMPSEEATAEGDALGEVYLTVPSKGAVASYASTGFEFLQPNNFFHESMWSTIFEKRYFRGVGGGSVDSDTLSANWLLSALLQVAEISHSNLGIINRQCLLGDPLLRLDAGVPRFEVVRLVNARLFEDGRIGALVPTQPCSVYVAVRDEQGLDSLWVEKRFRDGRRVPIQASIVAMAGVDTAAQIRAKRGYDVSFAVLFDTCDFDLAVGARDLAGRVSELYGRAQFDEQLLANGLPVESGSVVDARTAFRYVVQNCVPDSTLDLAVFLDGQPVQGVQTTPDELYFTWFADFGWSVAPGTHQLAFRLDGQEIASLSLVVPGGLVLRDVLAFPNPFADRTHFFFNLDSEISGGHVRITDLNGRTVRLFDLRGGTLQDLRPDPSTGGGLGTTMALNYVEWDGTDSAGEQVANGVYFYDILITDVSGHEVRKRDKVVVMR